MVKIYIITKIMSIVNLFSLLKLTTLICSMASYVKNYTKRIWINADRYIKNNSLCNQSDSTIQSVSKRYQNDLFFWKGDFW